LFSDRINTQEPSQPRIINAHTVVLLVANTFYFIIILFAIEPITIHSRTRFLLERKNPLHLPFTQRTTPKITGFFLSPEKIQLKKRGYNSCARGDQQAAGGRWISRSAAGSCDVDDGYGC